MRRFRAIVGGFLLTTAAVLAGPAPAALAYCPTPDFCWDQVCRAGEQALRELGVDPPPVGGGGYLNCLT